MIDYIDNDVAYLLGLIVARGTISEERVITIKIEFPFRNLVAIGIKKCIEQKDKILASLTDIRKRINELTHMDIREEVTEHSVILIMETTKRNILIRDLDMLLQIEKHGKPYNPRHYYEFEVPPIIFKTDDIDIKKEFLRGFADVAGSARASNVDQAGKHRIYLDVLNPNWKLPVQLCHLLQDHLQIPVQTITWGHPNIRDPNLKEYNAGRENAWAREHQIKIYADDFEKIGFYMRHKQEILKELADYNRQHFDKADFCSPPKTIRKKKKPHPCENSDRLPAKIRGKHYDAYWEICCDLGCPRCEEFWKKQKRLI